MDRVAILGLGLMGGSLGAALASRGFSGTVTAYARREATRKEALERGWVDAVFEEPADAVDDADIIVCCVPILSIPGVITACRRRLKAGCVVTDVGSTKRELADLGADALDGVPATFIGSHPIAGSEQPGIDAGHADLYEGATVVVTPSGPDVPGLVMVRELWTSVGAKVVVMDPARHDRLLARTSHLPHVVASALALTVGRDGDTGESGRFCGTGFRDTTRVAEGSPDVWLDILRTNKVELARELRAFAGEVEVLVRYLEAEDFDAVYAYLERGRSLRQALARGAGS